jgi:hypothetical protein
VVRPVADLLPARWLRFGPHSADAGLSILDSLSLSTSASRLWLVWWSVRRTSARFGSTCLRSTLLRRTRGACGASNCTCFTRSRCSPFSRLACCAAKCTSAGWTCSNRFSKRHVTIHPLASVTYTSLACCMLTVVACFCSQLNPKPYLEFYQQLTDEIARCYAEMLECKVQQTAFPTFLSAFRIVPPRFTHAPTKPRFMLSCGSCVLVAQAANAAQGGRREGKGVAEDERTVSRRFITAQFLTLFSDEQAACGFAGH